MGRGARREKNHITLHTKNVPSSHCSTTQNNHEEFLLHLIEREEFNLLLAFSESQRADHSVVDVVGSEPRPSRLSESSSTSGSGSSSSSDSSSSSGSSSSASSSDSESGSEE